MIETNALIQREIIETGVKMPSIFILGFDFRCKHEFRCKAPSGGFAPKVAFAPKVWGLHLKS